jgi:hypothetical protein
MRGDSRHWGAGRLLGAAVLAGALLGAQPAAAQAEADGSVREELREEVREFDVKKGSLLVGAGATAYMDGDSPESGFTLEARYDYPLTPRLGVEGSLQGSYSEDDRDHDEEVLPLLAEIGAKASTRERNSLSLFGAAGVGYGAFLGSDELDDLMTVTLPVSGGLAWRGRDFSLEPRVTWRPVLLDDLGDRELDADSWTAVLDVGLPFL